MGQCEQSIEANEIAGERITELRLSMDEVLGQSR